MSPDMKQDFYQKRLSVSNERRRRPKTDEKNCPETGRSFDEELRTGCFLHLSLCLLNSALGASAPPALPPTGAPLKGISKLNHGDALLFVEAVAGTTLIYSKDSDEWWAGIQIRNADI